MFDRPRVVVFDVFETLFSLESLRPRLEKLGLPGSTLELWLALTLRNGLALSASRAPRPFLEVAGSTLSLLAAQRGIDADASAVQAVMAGFGTLEPFPDVRSAFELLDRAGIRIATLSNGGAAGTERLLEMARLDGAVEQVLSVDSVGVWKPFPEPYQHAARAFGVAPEEVALVTAHAWDVCGATAVGLTTAWIARQERALLQVAPPPTVSGRDLTEVIHRLLAAPMRREEAPAADRTETHPPSQHS